MIRMEIACFLIVFFMTVMYFSAKRERTAMHMAFSKILIFSLINLVLDGATVYSVNHLYTVSKLENDILHRLFICTMTIIFCAVYRYTVSLIEDETKEAMGITRFSQRLLIISMLCSLLLPIKYIQTPNGNYSAGLAVYTAYIIIGLYLAVTALTLLRFWKRIQRKKRTAISLALAIEIIVSLYQANHPLALISGMGITLIIFSFYMTMENPDILLAEQVKEEKQKAERANEAKSAFLSNMSHEIRTPMNAIVGMTEILLGSNVTQQQRSYLMNIKSSGNALVEIINDILDISKIESGKMELIDAEYEPMSMLSDISMMIQNRIGDKPVELIYDIDKELPSRLYGDGLRIRQIIINLLNNAVKFTEEGYVKLTISVDKKDAKNLYLNIAVADSGQGIKPEDQEKLFGNFVQVNAARNREKEGSGLGLSICKQLVEMMNGTIGLRSEYGTGSEFYFSIPQEITDDKPAAALKDMSQALPTIGGILYNNHMLLSLQKLSEAYGITFMDIKKWGTDHLDYLFVDEVAYQEDIERIGKYRRAGTAICLLHNPMRCRINETEELIVNKPLYSLNFCQILNQEELVTDLAGTSTLNFTAPKARILVVDDNEMNLKVAVGLLAPLGATVDLANSGQKAIRMIQNEHYDVVFLDHMMPVMDGVEATQRIRAMNGAYYQTLPIIALTANAVMEARESFKQAGMNDFVAKPIDTKLMFAALKKWLPQELIIKGSTGTGKHSAEKKQTAETGMEIEGLDVAEGIKNSGGKELFESLLGDFYKLIDMKSSKIEKCLADDMLHDYTIEVHALKSTARMIGAMELSEQFKKLEEKGNEEGRTYLTEQTPIVLAHYRSYKEILKPYGTKQDADKEETSKEELLLLLKGIKEAVEGFNLDCMDDAMQELEKYKLPQGCNEDMENLRAYIADVAMEDIIRTTEQMMERIQAD